MHRLGSHGGQSADAWSLTLRVWQGSWCLCRSDTSTGVIDAATALATEMSLQAEWERAALAGRLAQLTHAWREAEEIAAIADSL
jgi:hypothetical protein